MKMKRNFYIIGSFLSAAAALAIMVLPTSAVMVFAPGPHERFVQTYSYFSPMLFGYGNWFPIITAVLTGAALLLLLVQMLAKKGQTAVLACAVAGFVASLLAVLLFGAVSVLGIVISVLLLFFAVLQVLYVLK